MKLIIAIISNDDASSVTKALLNNKFFVTKLASTGGLLRKGNTTLMIGVDDNQTEEAVKIITDHSKSRTQMIPNSVVSEYGTVSFTPIEVHIGGATMFIVDVEKIIKI